MDRRRRTFLIEIAFDDAPCAGRDWAFPLPGCMRERVDVLPDTTTAARAGGHAVSQGVPPLLRFAPGDVFVDPPAARRGPWGAVPVRRVVQVAEAEPDVLAIDGVGVVDGVLAFDLWPGAPGTVAATRHRATQRGFLGFLRSGEIPDAAEAEAAAAVAREASRLPLVPARFEVLYRRADGTPSRRVLTLLALQRSRGQLYLSARCHAKEGIRTFRLDRVERLVDGDGVVTEGADVATLVAKLVR
ncbi:MAG: WYL domain-containing protein [Phenylobacterium sp.]|uniref:WYL domain-containing protein n=1 Tax=Phenylobacterium sp. TaxID=1871053 RepID=UPI0025E38C07|nr:WYL domain-containing protein [Phenylobacterium sp.]MCA6305264.1 WYL domain-containing protein [Phenylobacterium sp.]